MAGHNGDVFTYRVLAHHLSPDQPFYGLQPPGLDEGGSTPLTRVEDLAGYFAQQIREFHPTGPMTIAGYCAGGTIAFELARQLTESGAQVSNLLLFGAPYSGSYRVPGQALAVVQEGIRRGHHPCSGDAGEPRHASAFGTLPGACAGSWRTGRRRPPTPS